MARYWWVNQGQSYEEEERLQVLWAPLVGQGGRTYAHWDSMSELEEGDLVLSYAKQRLRSISRVTSESVLSPRPADLPADQWGRDGRLVRLSYEPLIPSIGLDEIPLDWRLEEPREGPFQVGGKVKVGYLYPLTAHFFESVRDRFADRFPEVSQPAPPWVPAEALAGAGDLVRRMIGRPLQTPSGKTHTIFGVTKTDVWVDTGLSHEGTPVPLQEVQSALDQLTSRGWVWIGPGAVDDRSAFIGALLVTLPGVSISVSPPIARLGRDPDDPVAPDSDAVESERSPEMPEGLPFEGDLDVPALAVQRGEQALLRRRLLQGSIEGVCALCHETYPAQFLIAAHIKKRSVCTSGEKRDLDNIAMLACAFGCDVLYERGYVSVDADGNIVTATTKELALEDRLLQLDGLRCLAHREETAQYFEWHYKFFFRD